MGKMHWSTVSVTSRLWPGISRRFIAIKLCCGDSGVHRLVPPVKLRGEPPAQNYYQFTNQPFQQFDRTVPRSNHYVSITMTKDNVLTDKVTRERWQTAQAWEQKHWLKDQKELARFGKN